MSRQRETEMCFTCQRSVYSVFVTAHCEHGAVLTGEGRSCGRKPRPCTVCAP